MLGQVLLWGTVAGVSRSFRHNRGTLRESDRGSTLQEGSEGRTRRAQAALAAEVPCHSVLGDPGRGLRPYSRLSLVAPANLD